MAIDGRPHEMDAVFDSRLDKDGDVFQAVRHHDAGDGRASIVFGEKGACYDRGAPRFFLKFLNLGA